MLRRVQGNRLRAGIAGGGSSTAPVVANQSIVFGRKTLVGAGGETLASSGPLTSVTLGAPSVGSAHFNASAYPIVPSSVPADAQYVYPNATATGPGGTSAPFTLTINTNANEWSVLPDNTEIIAAYANAGTGGGAIMLRAGLNATTAGPVTLAARAGVSELVISAYGYAAPAVPIAGTTIPDARLSTRPATIRGFAGTGVIDRLAIVGLRCIRDRSTETEPQGLIDLYKSSDHIRIEDNEISLLTPLSARNLPVSGISGLMRGIGSSVNGSGLTDDWLITKNWIHDISRGITQSDLTNSTVSLNLIFDAYTNFTTLGALSDTVSYLNNLCLNIWAASGDGGVDPHCSIGLSFDPASGGLTGPNHITVIGNVAHVGKARFLYDGQYPGATGWKWNDPLGPLAYQNLTIGENLVVVSANIAMQVTGTTNANIFNNTIVGTPDQNIGQNEPSLYLALGSNIRIWNNSFLGITQGTGWTGNEISGEYGNYGPLPVGVVGSTGQATIFRGDPVKGFSALTIEEVIAAYLPTPGWYNATAGLGYGASGYVLGSGAIPTPTFAEPAPTGGTPATYPWTAWSTAYAQIASGTIGSHLDTGTFVFQMRNVAPAGTKQLFVNQFSGISLAVIGTLLRVTIRNSAGTTILGSWDVKDIIPATANLNVITMALSYDLSEGRVTIAVNGNPITIYSPLICISDLVRDNTNTWRIGANATAGNKYSGEFAFAAYTSRFIDLWTVAGLNEIYASTGALRALSGAWQLIYYGDAAALSAGPVNFGTGTGFVLNGTVTDVGTITGEYFGNRYFGPRYFGQRYFG